jgi:tRNA-splicing ligase RtcB (3'-phosphate/5'-hydroxy nucleic acid ligase)
MIKSITTNGLEIKLWTDEIDEGAYKQILNLSNHPFAKKHIVVLPDCHEGYGMPIGAVIATSGVVIPNAVGVDIGCGMSAIKTNLQEISTNDLKNILSKIRVLVPLGFKHHDKSQGDHRMPDPVILGFDPMELPVVSQEYSSALHQVGTLGGGNHFIEIQKGDDGFIWIMIHSGSRNIGKKVADFYNREAVGLNKKAGEKYGPQTGLAWLSLESGTGNNYMREMCYCLSFAFHNRHLMMDRIATTFEDKFGSGFEFGDLINIPHNYASVENHFGENLVVHRKGATRATKGLMGIVPGSQGTKSFIVEGTGNPDSFESCSHGSGRAMCRNQAIKTLNLQEEIARLDKLHIIHSIRTRSDLDEAPSAYKNIDEVLALQTDLVKVLVKLSPLAVIKG